MHNKKTGKNEKQPSNQATKQPSNQATKQPSNQATKQPSKQPSNTSIFVAFLMVLTLVACKKDFNLEELSSEGNQVLGLSMPDGYEETILGNQRSNPYTVSHMRQAHSVLYGTVSSSIAATHYYIRIVPQDAEMLKMLDTMNINTYDYPLDYEVVKMGDYYLPSGRQPSDLPILYAVLPVGKSTQQFSYTILDTLHLGSSDEALIRKALELKGYDPDEEGYVVGRPPAGWNPNPIDPIDPVDPPLGPLVAGRDCACRQSTNPRNPGGCISVFDTQFSAAGNCFSYRGVSFVKVILKDTWFTEHEVWTNRTGCFFIPGVEYSRNVWMWVKFTHDRGHVRGVRKGWLSIWDWMFTVKDYVGKLRPANFNNLDVCYDHSMDEDSRARYYWNAATVFNGLHEYYDFAGRSGIGLPPAKLDIYIDRNDGGGVAYMFDKMTDKGPIWNNILLGGAIPSNWCSGNQWRQFLCPIINSFQPLVSTIVTFMPDIKIGCGNQEDQNGGAVLRPSDRLKETMYHETGHAAHYQGLPASSRNYFWLENVAYTVHVGTNANPYGDGTHIGAPLCAVVEMWGYHIGATIADAAYGAINSSPAQIQSGNGNALWRFNAAGNSSYWWALEDYDPNWTDDPSRWIPGGVLHDLMDNRVETGMNPVNDNVFGFTHQQFFNALQSDIISIPQYRLRFLQQNNNNNQLEVNTLFQSYGY